ncbi:MAG: glycoside hydrolase family 15 protein [Bacteroidales bacterium]
MNTLDYGVIGNCGTAALISKTGSIDWCCLPEFNSSSVFAKILDTKKGGSFDIIVNKSYTITQKYLDKTNILSTTYSNGNDVFEIQDFMPRYRQGSHIYNPPDIIRYFKKISGKPSFKINYNPKLEYAGIDCTHKKHAAYIKTVTTEKPYDSLYLYSDFDKDDILEGREISLDYDSYCLISYHQKLLLQSTERQYLKLQRTKVYWLNWENDITQYVHYQKEISRSSLVLKLLSYDKSGAVLAALTTSLPETIGEERNWDYRFCWIRDASMVIKIMFELEQKNVAKRFMNFIIDIIPDKDEKIQIMYGINKEKKLEERTLDHLAGYENSAPVRIGNAAYMQKQNDIYGILMDVIYQQFEHFKTSLDNSEKLWTITRSIVRIVADNWEKPDKGIWEIRSENKHFTFSKVLCWVAMDRAIKIANILTMYDHATKWQFLADNIRHDIQNHAWNEEIQSYTQSYGSTDLDAANLLMNNYGFVDDRDPRFIQTVKATKKELCVDGLMYRYKNKDDFGLPSSSFTICTFWLINSLWAIGEKNEARSIFEQLLSYSNHLGLFSEDIDFKTKRLLGNFPQAYSHLALIETAINLSEGKKAKDEIILENIRH